jgi:hypothetical protein
MSRADGVQGALRPVVAERAAAPAPEPAGDLFAPAVERRHTEGVATFVKREARAAEAMRRGPGRPAGSRNVSNREWIEWALRQAGGKHPFVELMRRAALGPASYHEERGGDRDAAFDAWVKLNLDLLPYLMARQAPVDESGQAVPGLVLQIGGAGVNTDAASEPPWMRAFRTAEGETLIRQQDQGVIEEATLAAPPDPNGSHPNAGGKP